MMSIATQLTALNATKTSIANALTEKGVDLSNVPFSSYGDKILGISAGGSAGGATAEWSQDFYDSVFQNSLDSFDPQLKALIPEPSETEINNGGAYALVKVEDSDSEFAAVTMNFTGDCQIDWGDGTVDSLSNAAWTTHQYDYTNASLAVVNGEKYALVVINCNGSLSSAKFNNITDTNRVSNYVAISVFGEQLTNIYVSNLTHLLYFKSEKNKVSNANNMFEYCTKLTSIPVLYSSSFLSAYRAFKQCYSLTTIPQLDTSSVTNMESMFEHCKRLTTIPYLDTSSVTNMKYMFSGCSSLPCIPSLNTNLVTVMMYSFKECYSLTTIPQLDTSSVTNMQGMFDSCYSLTTIPQLDTSSVTTILLMFKNCYSLTTIPQLDTSSVANMSNMFYMCYSLTTIPQLDTSSVTNMSFMFYRCKSLTVLPQLDTSSVTNMYYMFIGCDQLSDINNTVITVSTDITNARISSAQLNEIYTNLPIVTGQTLNVSGNWGVAEDDPSIATAKGWTITG